MYEWMNNRWLMMNESPRRILGSGSGCGSGLEKSGSAIDEVNLLLPILFTVMLLSKNWSEQINLGKSTETSFGLEKSGSAIDEVNLLLPILFTVILLSKKWSEQINLGKSTENSSGHKLLHLAATMSFFGLKKDALLLFELFLQESMLQLFLTGIMQVTSSEIVTKH